MREADDLALTSGKNLGKCVFGGVIVSNAIDWAFEQHSVKDFKKKQKRM